MNELHDPVTLSMWGIASLVTSLTGFALVWAATDWLVALGLLIVLMANNMAHSIRLLTLRESE